MILQRVIQQLNVWLKVCFSHKKTQTSDKKVIKNCLCFFTAMNAPEWFDNHATLMDETTQFFSIDEFQLEKVQLDIHITEYPPLQLMNDEINSEEKKITAAEYF